MLRGHKELPHDYPCDVCNPKLIQEDTLGRHRRMQRKFPCDECWLKFLFESNLKYHKNRYHASSLNPSAAKGDNNMCVIDKETDDNNHVETIANEV